MLSANFIDSFPTKTMMMFRGSPSNGYTHMDPYPMHQNGDESPCCFANPQGSDCSDIKGEMKEELQKGTVPSRTVSAMSSEGVHTHMLQDVYTKYKHFVI